MTVSSCLCFREQPQPRWEGGGDSTAFGDSLGLGWLHGQEPGQIQRHLPQKGEYCRCADAQCAGAALWGSPSFGCPHLRAAVEADHQSAQEGLGMAPRIACEEDAGPMGTWAGLSTLCSQLCGLVCPLQPPDLLPLLPPQAPQWTAHPRCAPSCGVSPDLQSLLASAATLGSRNLGRVCWA